MFYAAKSLLRNVHATKGRRICVLPAGAPPIPIPPPIPPFIPIPIPPFIPVPISARVVTQFIYMLADNATLERYSPAACGDANPPMPIRPKSEVRDKI
jgi:hypothetical protein